MKKKKIKNQKNLKRTNAEKLPNSLKKEKYYINYPLHKSIKAAR